MPFLRVVRDRRGYETTYLMDLYRDGNRQRSRILYAFRSPGGVRVGCVPLQPEILRQIEQQFREITFDWRVVLESRQIIESGPEFRTPKGRRRVEASEEEVPSTKTETEAQRASAAEPREAQRPAIPSLLEGTTADEQSAFLARWYPIVHDRISRHTADSVRREALLSLAERLNPSAWDDADEVASGLQQAAEALERLSLVLTRRRRRRPQSPPRKTEPADPQIPQGADAAPNLPGGTSVPET